MYGGAEVFRQSLTADRPAVCRQRLRAHCRCRGWVACRKVTMTQTIRAAQIAPPPGWAISQRHLIENMNEAAPVFQERYTRPDGSFIWRQTWPGMDGSDDGYESYHNWPLFYALGGSADL